MKLINRLPYACFGLTVLAALSFCCESQNSENESDYEIKSDTLVVVLCDLTLEDIQGVKSVAANAKKLLQTSFSESKRIEFYLVDYDLSPVILDFQLPKSEVVEPVKWTPATTREYNRKRKEELKKFRAKQDSAAIGIERILMELYETKYKKLVKSPISCLLRTFDYSNNIFRASTSINHDVQILVFLSDMVITCRESFCGERVLINKNTIEGRAESIEDCLVNLNMDYVDKIIPVIVPNAASISSEKISSFWGAIFEKAGVPDGVINNTFFLPTIPRRALN